MHNSVVRVASVAVSGFQQCARAKLGTENGNMARIVHNLPLHCAPRPTGTSGWIRPNFESDDRSGNDCTQVGEKEFFIFDVSF